MVSLGALATTYSMSLRGVQRAGGVIGIADVDHAGIGGRGEHSLDVVGGRALGIGEGHLDDARAGDLRGPHGRFIAGIGDDQWLVLAGKGEHGVVQGLRRAGKGNHGLRIEAFLLGEDFGRLVFQLEEVAATAGNDVDHGLARAVRGAHGILIGVDVYALVGIAEMGARGARARCDSVSMGTVASAEAPAAKRKNERRERPLQATGSIGGCIHEISSGVGWAGRR